MKYFLDTEFHEYKTLGNYTIELISIGIVAEDGREFYRVSNAFNLDKAYTNDWLRENVLKSVCLDHKDAFTFTNLNTVREEIGWNPLMIAKHVIEFVGDDPKPEFFGYYADYDWVVFCWLFGRMIDLPKGFPSYCRDLKQMLDEAVEEVGFSLEAIKEHISYPEQENEHNALADAHWNAELFAFIQSVREASWTVV